MISRQGQLITPSSVRLYVRDPHRREQTFDSLVADPGLLLQVRSLYLTAQGFHFRVR